MNPAIEIKNLSFSYGDTENQLKHINLSVEKGEVIVLTGPSGSGKSTLTRVINGLIPYFFTGELSGEVWLFGKNMAEIPYDDLIGDVRAGGLRLEVVDVLAVGVHGDAARRFEL